MRHYSVEYLSSSSEENNNKMATPETVKKNLTNDFTRQAGFTENREKHIPGIDAILKPTEEHVISSSFAVKDYESLSPNGNNELYYQELSKFKSTPQSYIDRSSRQDIIEKKDNTLEKMATPEELSTAQTLLNFEQKSRSDYSSPPDVKKSKGQAKKVNCHKKPSHSYIALISKAILSSREQKMRLGDIYTYIMKTFPYYNNEERSWRNSIRHNLSVNECFVKSKRSENNIGHYWSIHPACVEDFAQGDYRRRQARRRARHNTKDLNQPTIATQVPCQYNNTAYSQPMGYVPMSSTPTVTMGYDTYHPQTHQYVSSGQQYQQPQQAVGTYHTSTHPMNYGYQNTTLSTDYQTLTSLGTNMNYYNYL